MEAERRMKGVILYLEKNLWNTPCIVADEITAPESPEFQILTPSPVHLQNISWQYFPKSARPFECFQALFYHTHSRTSIEKISNFKDLKGKVIPQLNYFPLRWLSGSWLCILAE